MVLLKQTFFVSCVKFYVFSVINSEQEPPRKCRSHSERERESLSAAGKRQQAVVIQGKLPIMSRMFCRNLSERFVDCRVPLVVTGIPSVPGSLWWRGVSHYVQVST